MSITVCRSTNTSMNVHSLILAIRATIPGETKTGRKNIISQAKQYCKTITKLLKEHGLTRDMMKGVDGTGSEWRDRLAKIFPKVEKIQKAIQ